jgi:hypothetical protein
MASALKKGFSAKLQPIEFALWGNAGTTCLEQRIFNTIILMVVAASLSTLINNIALGNPVMQTVISIICLGIATGAYTFSRKTGRWRQLTLGLAAFFFIALCLAWFYTAGSFGSIPFYFFIMFTAAILLLERKVSAWFIGIMLVSIGGLLYMEQRWPNLITPYDNDAQRFYDVVISLLLSLSINGAIVYVVFTQYIKERKQKDLLLKQSIHDKEEIEKAFNEIKILRGYLPICCNCKKIRDDEGYWNQIESYISQHSEAKFSHGICPACAAELYPEF